MTVPRAASLEMRPNPRAVQPRVRAPAASAWPVRPETPKMAIVVMAFARVARRKVGGSPVLPQPVLGNRRTACDIALMVEPPLPETISPRSRTATLLLGIFTGFVGGHRFFAGKIGTGLLMTCTLGGLGLWWLADLIVIGTGEFTDKQGRRIVNWAPDEDRMSARFGPDPRLGEEMEQLRGEVYDLQERVDFLERTLAQVRERPGLGPGSRS
jgi:hypothetical protein